MGVGVSNWELASAVSAGGQLGVVSGTALSAVIVRRLQSGDATGAIRRALAHCPLKDAARAVEARYFNPAGLPPDQPYRLTSMYSIAPPDELVALTIIANFVEVWLAKAGHTGVVGINLLEKIQLPTLASLYGAMLANVDYVLMGAGIPRAIPAVLDHFAAGEKASLRITVDGASATDRFFVGARHHHRAEGERTRGRPHYRRRFCRRPQCASARHPDLQSPR
jgi:nitronate monooxygenase